MRKDTDTLISNQPPLEQAITAYMRGLSLEAAARKHGVNKVTLWHEMRRRGYRLRTGAHSDGKNTSHLPGWLLDEHPRLTAQQIADIAGCSRNTVVKHLRKRGTYQPMQVGAAPSSRMSNSTKNQTLVLQAVAMSERGLTAGQIGLKLGVPRSTVNGWLGRYRRGAFLWQKVKTPGRPKCARCGCYLSKNREDAARHCVPCYNILARISRARAANMEPDSDSARAFIMRWDGYLWREIATELGYTKITTVHNRARLFAAKRGLILPQTEETTP